MKIQRYEYEGEGLIRVYDNKKWTVGIKNWKNFNDIVSINCLERHNKTDELFVLLNGRCLIIFANEIDGELIIGVEEMKPMQVYNIPQTLWHNTVMKKDTKLLLIEDSSTSIDNTDIINLNAIQIAKIKEFAKKIGF